MAPMANPFRRYKDEEQVSYVVLADRLLISEDYARKLGAGIVRSVSPDTADKFDRLTGGRIAYAEMMEWARPRKPRGSRKPRSRKRRCNGHGA